MRENMLRIRACAFFLDINYYAYYETGADIVCTHRFKLMVDKLVGGSETLSRRVRFARHTVMD